MAGDEVAPEINRLWLGLGVLAGEPDQLLVPGPQDALTPLLCGMDARIIA